MGVRLQQRLAGMIADRLPDRVEGAPGVLIASAIAAAQLAMLRMWTSGEVSCPVGVMAERIAGCGRVAAG